MSNNGNKKAKDLLSKFKKGSTLKYANVYSDDEVLNTIESTSTPIPILNLALNGKFLDDGGIEEGITVFAGESRTFKTYVSLIILKAYLDKHEDGVGFIYDSEFSMKKEYLGSLGIDTDRVFISRIENIEQLKVDMVNQLKNIEQGDKVMFLVDSIGNLASLKELEDAEEGKIGTVDMTRAKMLKSFGRMVTGMISLRKIPCIFINHVYTEQKMYGKTIMSGGQGPLLSAQFVIIMSKRKTTDKSVDEGDDFVMTIMKSRAIKEKLKFPITIPANEPIKKFSGLFDLALETGYILREGKRYSVPEKPDFGLHFRKEIDNDKDFWNMMFTETTFVKEVQRAVSVSTDQSSLFNNEIEGDNDIEIMKAFKEELDDHSNEEE